MASLILLSVLLVPWMVESVATKDTCDRLYQKVGCFNGNKTGLVLAITDRDHTSKFSSGKYLRWNLFQQDIRSLVCRCNDKANELKYEYFAIEYYAECWMVSDLALIQSNPAQGCVNVNFKTCGKGDEECAGIGFHQYVYKASGNWLSTSFADSAGIKIKVGQTVASLQRFPRQYMFKANMTVDTPTTSGASIMDCAVDGPDDIPVLAMFKSWGIAYGFGVRVNGTYREQFIKKTIEKGQYIDVIISQILKGAKYISSIIVNGKKLFEAENYYPKSWGPTTCYAYNGSFSSWPALDATLRDGVIRVKGE